MPTLRVPQFNRSRYMIISVMYNLILCAYLWHCYRSYFRKFDPISVITFVGGDLRREIPLPRRAESILRARKLRTRRTKVSLTIRRKKLIPSVWIHLYRTQHIWKESVNIRETKTLTIRKIENRQSISRHIAAVGRISHCVAQCGE